MLPLRQSSRRPARAWLLLAVLGWSSAVAQPSANLIPGPRLDWPDAQGGSGHQFQAVEAPGGINWADAQAWAEKRGGYLAAISSAQENDFIFKLIDDPKFWVTDPMNTNGPWLGGTKAPTSTRPDEGWHWANNAEPITYYNWASGEPNNDKGVEDKLEFFALGVNQRAPTWDDANGNILNHGFVVEFNSGQGMGQAQDPLKLLWPLLIITSLSGLIFILGLMVFFFRKSRREEDDPGEPPAATRLGD